MGIPNKVYGCVQTYGEDQSVTFLRMIIPVYLFGKQNGFWIFGFHGVCVLCRRLQPPCNYTRVGNEPEIHEEEKDEKRKRRTAVVLSRILARSDE